MAGPIEGGGTNLPSYDAVPEYIVDNLNDESEAAVRSALNRLVEWAEDTGNAAAARAAVEDAWDRTSDALGYLAGVKVPLHDFWEAMRALDPERDVPQTTSGGTSGSLSGARLTPELIRDIQADYEGLREIRLDDDGRVVVEIEGELSASDMRDIGSRVGGAVTVERVGLPAPSDGNDVSPSPAPSGGVEDAAGSGGGTTQAPPADPTLPEPGAPRQIPGGAKLWRVGGRDVYLAYKVPGTNVPLVWKVENPDRLKAIYGDNVPDYDRELTRDEFKRQSPWYAGLTAEIQNTDEHPWQQFLSDFNQAADLRPWLRDPTMQAVIATAYLEGREPTRDELSQTDWWQGHTADERAWLEDSVTLGKKEVRRRKEEASRAVAEALREAGMSNAPDRVVDYIAQQRLTGRWSEGYTQEQIRKLADPWAPGKLDKGILAAVRDPELGEAADARAVSEGRDAVRERVRLIFENRRVPIGTSEETEDQRLNRIARQIMQGRRTFSDVRNSVDWLAARTDGGRVGGLDVADEGRDRVRQMARQWLGPVAGQLEPQALERWAGRLRNDPEGGEEQFLDFLRNRRKAMFPGYEDESLTYEDIVSPVRNMATNIWGQAVHDEMFLVDLANMESYTDMSQRLRQEGLSRNVEKVTFDMLSGLQGTDLGGQVVRSQV